MHDEYYLRHGRCPIWLYTYLRNVLQNTFLMGGDIACFPLSMYYYNFFTSMSTTFLSFQGKILVDIIVKYLGLRLSCMIIRPVTNNIQLLDEFR